MALLEQRALAVEEAADIGMLLDGIAVLPPDSKLRELKNVIRELRRDGFGQAMVFTQTRTRWTSCATNWAGKTSSRTVTSEREWTSRVGKSPRCRGERFDRREHCA